MKNNLDLTIISNLNIADGIGRQGAGLLSCIKDDLNVNTLLIQPANYKDVPKNLMPILAKPFNHQYGKVAFWTYILGLNDNLIPLHSSIKSEIKIAYSMFESNAIPDLWVKILNSYYDMVVVPDEWLVDVYKHSGVKIPIFVLPLGIWLEDFLAQPIKEKQNDVFTFGMTAGFWQRKNHKLLINSFAKEFGNNFKFKLKIHGRFGPEKDHIKKIIEEIKFSYSNIEFNDSPMSKQEYLQWFKSLDCYVFPSGGEGFSITPRESLALGIPVILTNNTAHKTIINSPCKVLSIKSDESFPAYYEVFKEHIGDFFLFEYSELKQAMVKMANEYQKYLEYNSIGREWVKQYLWSSLKRKYLSLLRPTNIILGQFNSLEEDKIICSDKNLYNKIKTVFNI